MADTNTSNKKSKFTMKTKSLINFFFFFSINFLSFVSLTLSNSVHREETFEIRNKGTLEEETFVNGLYWFKGIDGYRYTIKYTIDKNGTHTDIESFYIHRIPPTLLKTLVG